MTRGTVKPFPAETFRIKLTGVTGSRVEAVDVLSGTPVALQATFVGKASVEITMAVTDKPAIISIQP
jgi:hypothetical protein